jgi:hypothetical protein
MYHAAIRTLHALLRSLRDAFESTVFCFKVHYCGPIVAYKYFISVGSNRKRRCNTDLGLR